MTEMAANDKKQPTPFSPFAISVLQNVSEWYLRVFASHKFVFAKECYISQSVQCFPQYSTLEQGQHTIAQSTIMD